VGKNALQLLFQKKSAGAFALEAFPHEAFGGFGDGLRVAAGLAKSTGGFATGSGVYLHVPTKDKFHNRLATHHFTARKFVESGDAPKLRTT
jgi:hypothetical protein